MKKLEIFLEKNVYFPGEEVRGYSVLRLEEELEVRKIKLLIQGLERTSITVSSGKHSHTYIARNYIFDHRGQLAERGILDAGEHKSDISFKIPEHALPTYSGTNAKVNYMVKVQADVPFWFDVKAQKTFWVIYDPARVQASTKPISMASKHYIPPGSPLPDDTGFFDLDKPKPGLYVELDRDTYFPGEYIKGKITINNPTDKTIRKVKVLLLSEEYATAQGHSRHTKMQKHKHKLEKYDISEGTPFPFSIPVPKNVYSTYNGMYSRLYWKLRLKLDIAFGFDEKLEIPIKIYRLPA
jgi:sporulation-control protein spo0M